MPTAQETRTVDRAMKTLCRQLDRFETVCAENNAPFERVEYVNRPRAEFSEFRVVYRAEPPVGGPTKDYTNG